MSREKQKIFAVRRKAMVLITAVGIILPMITNLTSANSLKRFQVCDKKQTNK